MNDLLIFIIKVNISLVVFYLFYTLLLKKQTFFKLNRIFLISTLVFALLFPAMKMKIRPANNKSLLSNISFSKAVSSNTIITNTDIFNNNVKKSSSAIPANQTSWMSKISLANILVFIYFLGFSIFLSRFLIHLKKLFSIIKNNGYKKYGNIRFVFIDKNILPFTFLNYIFLNNNSDFFEEDDKIIAHEFAHAKQLHSVDLLFIELLTVILWFNPVLWLFKQSFIELHEYLADNNVINRNHNLSDYQKTLLNQVLNNNKLVSVNNFNRSLTNKRLSMMTKTKSNRRTALRLLLIIPLISILTFAFSEPKDMKSDAEFIFPDHIVKTDNKLQYSNDTIFIKEITVLKFIDDAVIVDGKKIVPDNIRIHIKNNKKVTNDDLVPVRVDLEIDGKVTSYLNGRVSADDEIMNIEIPEIPEIEELDIDFDIDELKVTAIEELDIDFAIEELQVTAIEELDVNFAIEELQMTAIEELDVTFDIEEIQVTVIEELDVSEIIDLQVTAIEELDVAFDIEELQMTAIEELDVNFAIEELQMTAIEELDVTEIMELKVSELEVIDLIMDDIDINIELIEITGRVVSNKNDPLEGIKVIHSEKKVGTKFIGYCNVTNKNGEYTIIVPDLKGKLIFEGEHFESKSVKIKGQKNIDIKLKEK